MDATATACGEWIVRAPKLKGDPGMRFGYLVTVAWIGKGRGNKSIWLFECDCGAMTKRYLGDVSGAVYKGYVPHCGCLTSKNLTEARLVDDQDWAPTQLKLSYNDADNIGIIAYAAKSKNNRLISSRWSL